jgi:hypothetical protein
MEGAAPQSSPVLRWLEQSARNPAVANRPAVLRVQCIVALHMGDDGTCKLSQKYIAKRLGLSRQATNRHCGFLHRINVMPSKSEKAGLPKSYSLPEPANGD